MEGRSIFDEKKFASPEEELAFLRAHVREQQRHREDIGALPATSSEVAKNTLDTYVAHKIDEVLEPSFAMTPAQAEAIVLKLTPESHDATMAELLALIQDKGIKNALAVVEKMNNPHVTDDFHRFLVEYLREGHTALGLSEKSDLWRTLHRTLYEIALPHASGEEGKEKTLKELVASMEQFYAGMLSVSSDSGKDKQYFTLEIANANGSEEFVLYASVPDAKTALFEKQVLSIFPKARVAVKNDDYNVFSESGVAAASYATLLQKPAFAIKTYEAFQLDPLAVILNTFSKVKKDGEGVAIQILVRPAGERYTKLFKHAIAEIGKGVNIEKAVDIPITFFDSFKKIAGEFVSSAPKANTLSEKNTSDTQAIESITRKVASTIMEVEIRVVASAETEARTRELLEHVESAFNQFTDTHGNGFGFERLKRGSLTRLLRQFAFRDMNDGAVMPLNIGELTTVFHFPQASASASAPQLKHAKANTAPAPLGLPTEGLLLGTNTHRGQSTQIVMAEEDRLRHFYTIGQTGTGKSTLIKNMAAQDIKAGKGVCFIDPHGSDIQDLLSVVPPERFGDVIYFDPAYTARPVALNMLEYDARFPEQKTFVVNEMLSIFNKLFDMKTAGGPMFEQYFRNAVMLVIEDPESGSTLLDVSRVLAVKSFRDMKLARCKNPIVVQFWKEIAEKAGGESSLANIVPYITSKFDVFLSNEIMRPVIAQETSSFNFRQIMDEKKILLVNLSKGRLGDINANLIGLILVGKILMAALSRADSFGKDLPPFYLYIDEFQNITTDSIATILSEARKYKLSLTIAHQFIAQLEDKIKDAVFGNVGSLAVFRVGAEDAEYLEKQFVPTFTAQDIMNIDNRNAYVKLLVSGRTVTPFNVEMFPPPKGNPAIIEKMKELSYLTHGRDRAEVEAAIMKKYEKKPIVSVSPTINKPI
ncbi:MAG: type IV secretory system conjugative DNA transfer family protein [Patescibacteria group bacterium]